MSRAIKIMYDFNRFVFEKMLRFEPSSCLWSIRLKNSSTQTNKHSKCFEKLLTNNLPKFVKCRPCLVHNKR